MAMFKKYFTPEEANKRLPLIKKIVDEILTKGKELNSLAQPIRGTHPSTSFETIKVEIENLMDELESLGCFYKDCDFQVGLVDFPAIIDDEEVFLCWRSDEEEIGWYHSLEDGFAGRKAIAQYSSKSD